MRISRPGLIILIAVTLNLAACSSFKMPDFKPEPKPQPKSSLRIKAQSGDTEARYQLGQQYTEPRYADTAEAIYWLCEAAKDGYVPAQMRLARLYEDESRSAKLFSSKGSLANRTSAYFWYTAAASQGEGDALTRREALAASMSPEDILEAKQKATRWKQSGCRKPG